MVMAATRHVRRQNVSGMAGLGGRPARDEGDVKAAGWRSDRGKREPFTGSGLPSSDRKTKRGSKSHEPAACVVAA